MLISAKFHLHLLCAVTGIYFSIHQCGAQSLKKLFPFGQKERYRLVKFYVFFLIGEKQFFVQKKGNI